LARTVLADDAVVTVLARPLEDPHRVVAKPSFIPRVRQADLLMEMGLELEIGWLPVLLQGARRPDLRRIVVGALIEPLGRPGAAVDRSHGHVHAAGNPHALPDPTIAWRVVTELVSTVKDLRPGIAARVQTRAEAFAVTLVAAWHGETLPVEQAIATLEGERAGAGGGWVGAVSHLRGRGLVAHHDVWPYLARWAGCRCEVFLEPLPGVPPTQAHLTSLVQRMQAEGLGPILVDHQTDPAVARRVAEAVGTTVILVPTQPEDGQDYVAWMDLVVQRLGTAR
jgi:zinc/manganese transport system substrate-binding protein